MFHDQIQEFSGDFTTNESCRIAIVASRFNSAIVENLIKGSVRTLIRHGVQHKNISLTHVPGAFELPLIAKKWALSGKVDVIICLGTVIRGATPHFTYVCNAAANGINSAQLETGIPMIFGVLTTETIEQAIERSGTKSGNKGEDAALAALEIFNLIKKIP